jgi:general nucleoside transport system permease protein
VTVVQAVIVVFVAAPKLVQEIFRLRDVRRDGGSGAAPSVAPATAVDSAAEAV